MGPQKNMKFDAKPMLAKPKPWSHFKGEHGLLFAVVFT